MNVYSPGGVGGRNIYAVATAGEVVKAFIGSGSGTASGAGIEQIASGNTPTATLSNTGAININVVANANANGLNEAVTRSDGQLGGSAYNKSYAGGWAYATAHVGIQQDANTGANKVATDALTNYAHGTIKIGATAHANQTNAASAYASAYANSHGQAFASAGAGATANLFNGILQSANGYGASIGLTNSGEIDITAVATALSKNATASAYAYGSNNNANATAYAGAFANAYVGHGVSQYAHATSYGLSADATLSNGVGNILKIAATATAVAINPSAAAVAVGGGVGANVATAIDGASAYASIGTGIKQTAWSYGTGNTTLTNSGTITIKAVADAEMGGGADVYAAGGVATIKSGAFANGVIDYGIYQHATASASGLAQLTNYASGTINIGAKAVAQGDAASANAYVQDGIYQDTYGYPATAKLTNNGAITIEADAHVSGSGDNTGNSNSVYLTAIGRVGTGIYQYASAYSGSAYVSAYATLSNAKDATITIKALATGYASSYGYAEGVVNTGISQHTDGAASFVTLTNSGAINIEALATEVTKGYHLGVVGFGSAYAHVDVGVYQYADQNNTSAQTPLVTLTNNGTLDIGAKAHASASNAFAYADVGGTFASGSSHFVRFGVEQFAAGTSYADVTLTNTGTINIHATATAYQHALIGNPHNTGAYATASAYGVQQHVEGPTATLATFNNSGTFSVSAIAKAVPIAANSQPQAYAHALGLFANGDPVTLAYTNSSKFVTASTANHIVTGGFSVMAIASANASSGDARAYAQGIQVDAVSGYQIGTGVGAHWSAKDAIGGTLTNTGNIQVAAAADPKGLGGSTSDATALGIAFKSSTNNATLTNSGRIEVIAQNQIGNGNLSATGILVQNNPSSLVIPTSQVFTLDNYGGSIIARTSGDGGATWQHGTAIDLSSAPNASVINLQAQNGVNGYIYGNIYLSTNGDFPSTINVSNGETKFDGSINDGSNYGTLNINNGGTLYFANQPFATVSTTGTPTVNNWYDGASNAALENFNVNNGGTLALQLPVVPTGPLTVGSYPTINATNVTLGASSNLQVRPSSWNGLYGNSYTFTNVISSANDIQNTAQTAAGTFGTVAVISGYGQTAANPAALFKITADYSDPTAVSLDLTRTHFGAVTGLTTNQQSVGSGIEHIYSPTMTGPFAGLLGDLFTQDLAHYQNSLDQLSGQQYAGYLQSLNGLAQRYDDLVSSATDCGSSKAFVDPTCQRVGKVRLWGQINAGHLTKHGDADLNGGGYSANQIFVAMGVDYKFADNFVLGVAGGYVKDDLNFDPVGGINGGRVKSDGAQGGVYAVYDPGKYYVKAVVNYAALTAHATRNVDVLNMSTVPANGVHDATAPNNLNPSVSGSLSGSPKADILNLYGEVGYRFGYQSYSLTPYASINYTDAKLKAFSETGVAVADLNVAESKQDRTTAQLGLKIDGAIGKVIPELNLGWLHQFGSKTAAVNAAFAMEPGSNFTVLSSRERADTAFVDLGLSAVLGKNVVGKVGYQGRFNGDTNSNAGMATLIVTLGGK